MNLNIDSALFIVFLIMNLGFGLYSSRNVGNMRQYGIGDRNFSTVTLVATIVATWVSGSFFFNRLSETYTNGLYYICASTGVPICMLCIAYMIAPRMQRFLGTLSVAEAMGDLYGEKIRIVSAVASVIGSVGLIAVQLKVTGSLFEYCFGIKSMYGVIIGAFIITLYSAVGGIKSVTFTDVIQFFTFGTILPMVGFFLISEMEGLEVVQSTLMAHPSFDYRQVFDFTEAKSLYYLFLFFYFMIPALSPPIFQRISMSKDVYQAKRAFFISAALYFCLSLILIWIAILILSNNPNLVPKEIVKHLLFDYSYTGFKAIILIAIMAMVMSTADSYINSTAVICINDFFNPLKIRFFKNDLTSCRIAAVFIGSLALILALKGESLLKIVIACNSFYIPIISVPFLLAIFGFDTTPRAVGVGMLAGFTLVVSWYSIGITIIDPIVPGMVANLVFLMGTHYFLKEQGGWREKTLEQESDAKLAKRDWGKFFAGFNLKELILDAPSSTSSGTYIAVGFFGMVMLFATMHSMPAAILAQNLETINFIIFISLFISNLLVSHPLWLWKNVPIACGILWHFVIFSILIFVAFGFVVLTNFAPSQVMIFMMNLIIIAGLIKWQMAMLMVPVGILLSTISVQYYFTGEEVGKMIGVSSQMKIAYILLSISGVLAVIFRPKQEHQILIEEKNDHLADALAYKNEELESSSMIKEEFIRNATHEYHAPMTGLISTIDVLYTSYDTLSDEDIKKGLKNAYDSSHKLRSLDDNIVTLSQLAKPNYILKNEVIDFSDFVMERVETCRRLYEKEKTANKFVLDIDEEIITRLDRKYAEQLVDNLIINSIQYCSNGKVEVTVRKQGESIEFIIKDEGIGIPIRELYDIFSPFTVSSKTKTPAGGRGVGLAVCKRILEVYDGTIAAQSDGVKGAAFRFILPILK